MDCSNASDAERVCDCTEGVQCPNERKPIFLLIMIGRRYRSAGDIRAVIAANTPRSPPGNMETPDRDAHRTLARHANDIHRRVGMFVDAALVFRNPRRAARSD